MSLTQFEIKTSDDLTVKGEYEGNESSKKVIIFSHGFGVTRDSHGMFNEIGDALKKGYIIVRFDYTLVNKKENWTKVFPYSTQVKMLRAVHEYILQKFSPTEVNIVAHSMGCFITGLAQLKDINKIILLASPPTESYPRVKEYFSRNPESILNESTTSSIKRTDGSTTYVETNFWHELKDISPSTIYRQLAKSSQITFVRASLDQIFTENNFEDIKSITEIDYHEINGNHDFEGNAREELISHIQYLF